jgi:O-acetyl-ADP-ribose deacetylase (regulator of RNase III)
VRTHHLESVAFPVISCGIYGYPLDQAAAIAVREAQSFEFDRDVRILLVAFDSLVFSALGDALGSFSGDRDPRQ